MALVRPFDQPWETNYTREANDALERAWGPSDDAWRALRPPLPQIMAFPPRFGYPSYADRQPGVLQVFGLTRTPVGRIPGMPSTRGDDRVDYSQDQGSQSSSGSDRNTNSGDPLGLGGASW
jgi:hypothetical protein